MSTILITGGAGFIGSNVAETLLKNNGHDVVIVDTVKNPVNLVTSMEDITYVRGDIRTEKLIETVLSDYDVGGILHLAAVSRVIWGEENPQKCTDVNINGMKVLLEALKTTRTRPWLIFGSSREVYGEPTVLPVHESHLKSPINLYGRTKLIGEELVQTYIERLCLQSLTLRFSNVYGNEKDILDRVLPRFTLAALRGEKIEIHGGNQLLDFTHIRDTVDGIMRTIGLLEKRKNDGDNGAAPYWNDLHLLSGRGASLQDVVRTISKCLQNQPDVVYTDPRTYDVERFYGCPSKAREVIGFTADIPLEKGIQLMIERYKEVFDL